MNKFDEIKGFISSPRLNPYLDYCKSNKLKSLILYQMNLRLSAAFLPIISMLEVALRNAIDLRMTQNYALNKEDNWIEQIKFDIEAAINAKVIHKSDFDKLIGKIKSSRSSLNIKIENNIKNYLKRVYRDDKEFKNKTYLEKETKVNSELNHIKHQRGIQIKKHVLVASMDFGFWTTFFEPEPYRFLKGDLIKIYRINNSQQGKQTIKIQRPIIAQKLDEIRKFRNRISHNEPIIFSSQTFDSGYPKRIRENIMFILECLNQNLQLFSEDIYTINLHLQKIEDYCENIDKFVKN